MTARPDQRNVRISDDLWEWLEQERDLRGLTSRNDVLTAIIVAERTRHAAEAVQESAAPALEGLLEQQSARQVGRLQQALEPVLEKALLEMMQARMMAMEIISYLYDKDDLVCPYCRKRYMDNQGAVSFAHERGEIVLRRAQEAVVAGRTPKIRVW